MAKKLISLIIICCILIFAGCGSNVGTKPDNVSSIHYTAGTKAIEIIDDFLDMNITSEEAQTKLKEVEGRLPGDSKGDNLYIELDISILQSELARLGYSTDFDKDSISKDTKDIVKTRNDLAELVNEESREN